MTSVNLSVIVPVYNAERYLTECAGSVLAAPEPDIELILVDDGSTDHSVEICDRLASTDGRVRVIRKENGGVSLARNAGLAAAQGNYVLFLDADDAMIPEAFPDALRAARTGRYDMTAFAYTSLFSDGRTESGLFPNMNEVHADAERKAGIFAEDSRAEGKDTGKDICAADQMAEGGVCTDMKRVRDLLFGTPLLKPCWGKLFRRDIAKDIHFPKGVAVGEDYIFVMRFLSRAESACLVNEPLILYRQTEDGAMRSLNLKKHAAGLTAVWKTGNEELQRPENEPYRNAFFAQQFATVMYYLRMIACRYHGGQGRKAMAHFLKLTTVGEILAKARGCGLSGQRSMELRLVRRGNIPVIAGYVRVKDALMTARRKLRSAGRA
ncbi:MAG: glycosyltransferase family 2 protein [Chordicoccus sp.]